MCSHIFVNLVPKRSTNSNEDRLSAQSTLQKPAPLSAAGVYRTLRQVFSPDSMFTWDFYINMI